MKVLAIKSSILGQNSVSSAVVDNLVGKLNADQVITRDVSQNPLPYLDASLLGANPVGAELIAELQSADVLVIAAPLYNFGIPAQLKTYFDYVTKAGVTFKYTEAGTPEGLVKNKKAYVVVSSGGVYAGTPYAFLEQASTYVKTILGFIGVTDVTLVHADGVVADRQAALNKGFSALS